ncbi:MAG: Peptide deformylase [Alphaproteobacteria bacterium MarineAlpha5_Bin9]|nr:MAG: Peptide deformylase [Alphaproteobacteria bacterium MarineAlpha5_Bin9]|tara:strand:+ start:13045 stop:13557 length:513 start_codon:yes stop_codon:yes gene_type:complete
MKNILIVPDSLLRKKSIPLAKVTNQEIDISNKMIEIMKNAPGVGLAAIQIGIMKQIVTVRIKKDAESKEKIYSLFNPVITSYSKKKIIMEEGCLSIPLQFAEIERPEIIKVKYINEKNQIIEETKDGIESRILQHEIDHLSGILFIDYLSNLKKNMIIKKVIKLKKIGKI